MGKRENVCFHATFWDNYLSRLLCGPKKGRFVVGATAFNLRIRTGSCLASSGRRQRPWLWRSSSWHARCRWRHHGSRSPGKPSRHLGFPRRSDLRFSSHRLGEPDDGWQAWWYPGCYHEELSCDAWRPPFQDPFLLYLFQTCFWVVDENSEWPSYRFRLVITMTVSSVLVTWPTDLLLGARLVGQVTQNGGCGKSEARTGEKYYEETRSEDRYFQFWLVSLRKSSLTKWYFVNALKCMFIGVSSMMLVVECWQLITDFEWHGYSGLSKNANVFFPFQYIARTLLK